MGSLLVADKQNGHAHMLMSGQLFGTQGMSGSRIASLGHFGTRSRLTQKEFTRTSFVKQDYRIEKRLRQVLAVLQGQQTANIIVSCIEMSGLRLTM